jgi:hypothetical protein
MDGADFAMLTQGCQCCFMETPIAADPFVVCIAPLMPTADFCVDPGYAANNPDGALYECRHSCETGDWESQNAAGCHGDNFGNMHEDHVCVTETVYAPGEMQPLGDTCCSWCGDNQTSPDYYAACCSGMRADGEMGCEDTRCEWMCNGLNCFAHNEDQATCEDNGGMWEAVESCADAAAMQGMYAQEIGDMAPAFWLGRYGGTCCTGYEVPGEGSCADADIAVYVSVSSRSPPCMSIVLAHGACLFRLSLLGDGIVRQVVCLC